MVSCLVFSFYSSKVRPSILYFSYLTWFGSGAWAEDLPGREVGGSETDIKLSAAQLVLGLGSALQRFSLPFFYTRYLPYLLPYTVSVYRTQFMSTLNSVCIHYTVYVYKTHFMSKLQSVCIPGWDNPREPGNQVPRKS